MESFGRVLIIYTGGTIGMVPGPRGLIPVKGYLWDHLEQMPMFHDPEFPPGITPLTQLGRRIQYDLHEFEVPLDSSNMDADDWVLIAKTIEQHYEAYDGFVVLHGTDTMAYTASALSFMLDNLRKTVILTGSQIPLSQTRSDGADNLFGAMLLAGLYEIPEVGLYFHDQLLRGNRTRKVDSSGFNAFEAANYEPLVEVGIDVKVHWDRIRIPPEDRFQVKPITNTHVAALRLFPGMGADTLANFLRAPTEGLVIETYGSGNAPDTRSDFMQTLKEAAERGVVIVNCTQCQRGMVKPSYAAGAALLEVGVIPGADMTPEAALTKLSWLLSQKDLSKDDIREQMTQNLRGELTSVSVQQRFSLNEKVFIDQVARTIEGSSHPLVSEGIAKTLYPVLMCAAAGNGDIEALERMLAAGADPAAGDYDFRTPLHLACSQGQIEAAMFLVEHGADLHACDRWDGTPLLDAVRHGHEAIASWLVGKGAFLPSERLVSELCTYASKGELKPLRTLLQFGADPNIGDYDKRTPLHLAAAEGQNEAVKLLMSFGARVDIVDRWGGTPLDDAIRHGHEEIAEQLRVLFASHFFNNAMKR